MTKIRSGVIKHNDQNDTIKMRSKIKCKCNLPYCNQIVIKFWSKCNQNMIQTRSKLSKLQFQFKRFLTWKYRMSSTGTTPKGAIPSALTLKCSKPKKYHKLYHYRYSVKGIKMTLPAKIARKKMRRPMMVVVPMEDWSDLVSWWAFSHMMLHSNTTSTKERELWLNTAHSEEKVQHRLYFSR